MLGKTMQNMRKNVFNIHTNIVTKKWGGKNTRNNFSSNTRIVGEKMIRKNVGSCAKKSSLYSHEYRVKKGGEKTRETIFPEKDD